MTVAGRTRRSGKNEGRTKEPATLANRADSPFTSPHLPPPPSQTFAASPFVVRLLYSFADRAHVYMVMEYLPGGDLKSLLQAVGCLDEKAARIYAAEVLLAVEYFHSLGIVHRDLKVTAWDGGEDATLLQFFSCRAPPRCNPSKPHSL